MNASLRKLTNRMYNIARKKKDDRYIKNIFMSYKELDVPCSDYRLRELNIRGILTFSSGGIEFNKDYVVMEPSEFDELMRNKQ